MHSNGFFDANPIAIRYQRADGTWYTPTGYVVEEPISAHASGNTDMLEEQGRDWIGRTLPFVTIGALGFLLWGGYYFVRAVDNPKKAKALGAFGDYIGGTAGSLWALASVLLVCAAFLGQVRQTRLQEVENERLHRLSRLQQFENAFFQLLGLHNEIVRNLSLTHTSRSGVYGPLVNQPAPTKSARGPGIFDILYEELERRFRWKVSQQNADSSLDSAIETYEKFHEEFQAELGHYFRNLYIISEFVADSNIPQPMRYTKILRAQLSSNELLMLFYNCVSKFGSEKFKPLVEQFRLLKNIPLEQLLDASHADAYNDATIGRPRK